MRLGIKMLDSSSTLNRLFYVDEVYIYPGETALVYFQLIDESAGNRYIPMAGAAVNVNLYSVDDANNISKAAYNPFVDDRSIWAFNLNTTETNKMAGVNLDVTVTEGASIRKARGNAVIILYPKSPYQA